MGPVLLRLRAEFRSRWRAWLGLSLLLGVFGGAVLAVTAGGRRTDTAYPRFLESKNAYHVLTANLILIPAALLLANLISVWPGRSAARTKPALVLRTE